MKEGNRTVEKEGNKKEEIKNKKETSKRKEMRYEAKRITAKEFGRLFPSPNHIFNSVAFNELNKHKAAAVHYLAIMDDGKTRFGIVLGEREADGIKTLSSPFSAPFGSFMTNSTQRLESMEAAVDALRAYAQKVGARVKIALTPDVYDRSQTAKWVSVLSRKATLHHLDLNYFFELDHVTPYEQIISRSARKNLHNALKHEWRFTPLDTSSERDIERAYNLIALNRKEHGYPLRMSLHDVVATTHVVNALFFVLETKSDASHDTWTDVAAAQVFHVAKDTAQVIYWGDLAAYSHLRTMNRLAAFMYDHFSRLGVRILDIGPSTEDGEPNYGLCSFKEDIGCEVCTKHIFVF